MRRPGARLRAALLLLFVPPVVLPPVAAADPRGWSFVRSVGGLRVGEPVWREGQWRLPVHANVAGIERFTERPTLQDAHLACTAVLVAIERQAIYLTFDTAVVRASARARCPPALLGRPRPGPYTVFYRGPDEAPVRLRTVRIDR
jgi:hypothetical protein